MKKLPKLHNISFDLLSTIYQLHALGIRMPRIQLLTGIDVKTLTRICRSFGSIANSKGRDVDGDVWFAKSKRRMLQATLFWHCLLSVGKGDNRAVRFLKAYEYYQQIARALDPKINNNLLPAEKAAWVVRHLVMGEWESRRCNKCDIPYVTQTLSPLTECYHCQTSRIESFDYYPQLAAPPDYDDPIDVISMYNDAGYQDMQIAEDRSLPVLSNLTYLELAEIVALIKINLRSVNIQWLTRVPPKKINKIGKSLHGHMGKTGPGMMSDTWFYKSVSLMWQCTLFYNMYLRTDADMTDSRRFLTAYQIYLEYISRMDCEYAESLHLNADKAICVLIFMRIGKWELRECSVCHTSFVCRVEDLDTQCQCCRICRYLSGAEIGPDKVVYRHHVRNDFNRPVFLSFDQARKYVSMLGLKSIAQYKEWTKSGERPKNIPMAPDSVYKDKWQGWDYYLGKKESCLIA